MSKTYHAIYLPADKQITDGDTIMDSAGKTFIYDKVRDYELDLSYYRPAELMLVEYVFNEMKIVGKPSCHAVRKFLKPGDQILNSRCYPDRIPGEIMIKCPTCGDLQ